MEPTANTATRDDDDELEPSPRNNPTRELSPLGRKPRPLILSRFILLGQLGQGGSSMVYKAYDPQLDRKIALKLLQARRDSSSRAHTRLLREAQAMAKLTHPNVVTVHDVSEYGELDLGLEAGAAAEALEIPARGVFIVMELVEGGDLRRWLNRRNRAWRSVLAVMLAAGRGLAAAHEVGIVHRDFKPGNLLIDNEGRVLVSDFGLARASSPSSSSSGHEVVPDDPNWDDPADGNITRTGAVLGTPPYMSPEQHRGEGSDPRSDQFGFGVTLYEALFGVRPYSGSMGDMRQAKQEGRWRPIPSGNKIPARIGTVIERTLQPEPDKRFASMNEMLEALERAGRPMVTPQLLAGVTVLAAGIAVPMTFLAAEDSPCDAGDAHIERVWSPDRQSIINDAFEASAAPYAQAAGHRVKAGIDTWTTGWLSAYRDACEATHVRHEQSQQALDLRVSCLGRQLRELEAMTDLMQGGDPRVIENAVVSVQSLGDVQRCGDVAALTARVDAPATPEARARVEAGYGHLAEARAQELAGRYEDAVAISRDVSDEALAVEHDPLHAAAKLRMASALGLMGHFGAAEEHLLDAILAAERSRDEATSADAWIALVWIVGVEQNRHSEAMRWVRFAEAALVRLGFDPLRHAALDHNRGGVLYRLGRFDEALVSYQRAYEIQHEALGEQHPLVGQTVNHIGNVLIMQERFDEAQRKCEQSLAIRRETLGANHPRVAAPLNNLAEILQRQGDRVGALAYAEQALAITRNSGRPEELIAWVLVARQHENLGHPEQELAARRRVLTLLDEHPGFDQSIRPEHRERVTALTAPARRAPPVSPIEP